MTAQTMKTIILWLSLAYRLNNVQCFFSYHRAASSISHPLPVCAPQCQETSRRYLSPLKLSSGNVWVDDDLDNNEEPIVIDEAELQRQAVQKMMGLRKPTADEQKVRANNALLDWISANGVYIEDRSGWGVAPHPLAVSTDTVDDENESCGRGLIARRSINSGDELFSIPIDICVTKAKAQETFGEQIVTADTSEYIAIALLLMREKALGKDSFFWAYINILPTVEEIYPSFVWPESDLDLLEGCDVKDASLSMKNKLEAEYEATFGIPPPKLTAEEEAQFGANGGEGEDGAEDPARAALLAEKARKAIQSARDQAGGGGVPNKGLFFTYPDIFTPADYPYDSFAWAFAVLFSRAIRLRNLSAGEAVALVPYADLINHSPFSDSYIDAGKPVLSFLTKATDRVSVYSDRTYKKFEQIFISYGPRGNADLLLLYGFAMDRNPYTQVEITVGLTPEITGQAPVTDADITAAPSAAAGGGGSTTVGAGLGDGLGIVTSAAPASGASAAVGAGAGATAGMAQGVEGGGMDFESAPDMDSLSRAEFSSTDIGNYRNIQEDGKSKSKSKVIVGTSSKEFMEDFVGGNAGNSGNGAESSTGTDTATENIAAAAAAAAAAIPTTGDALLDEKIRLLNRSRRPLLNRFPLLKDRYPRELIEFLRFLYLSFDDLEGAVRAGQLVLLPDLDTLNAEAEQQASSDASAATAKAFERGRQEIRAARGGIDLPSGRGKVSLEEVNYRRPVSAENELLSLRAMRGACQSKLERYPTTEDEDAGMLNDRAMSALLSRAQRMAIRLRRTEKRILRRTIETIDRDIDAIECGDLERLNTDQ